MDHNIIPILKRKEKILGTYSPTWWEKNSFFIYPYIMMSYAHHSKVDNVRDMYKIPDDYTIYLDSGGFSQYDDDKDFDPIDVLKWHEKNTANVCFSLDNPITRFLSEKFFAFEDNIHSSY